MEQRLISPARCRRTRCTCSAPWSARSRCTTDPNNIELDEVRDKALKILGRAPTIIAYFDRYRRGLPLVHPRQDLSFAANFLYMLNGEEPTEAMTRAFDICMITHADHGLNNSTFAARVVISTLSDVYSALTAAIGSLRGPLHGGANEGVMKMLNEIPSVADAEAYIMGKLERKEKIMGFGHRVYKNTDPRATELKTLAKQLAADTGNMDLYEKSHAIERSWSGGRRQGHLPQRRLLQRHHLPLHRAELDLFTPMFALSRIGGLGGAHPRAARRQPPLPPRRGVRRPARGHRAPSLGPRRRPHPDLGHARQRLG
jgi:citrate synthase